MTLRIRSIIAADLEAVVRFSLRAWAPVFESIRQAMDPEIYGEFFPDWRASQRKSIEDVCTGTDARVWVAELDGDPVGFVAIAVDDESKMGEITMIAVDPSQQRRGIGKALMTHAIEQLQAAGMTVAMVETGGDSGHAPARQTYERLGFSQLPIARFFKKL